VLEHDPTRRQRRIDRHGTHEGIDSAPEISQRYIAVTTFLVEQTKLRMPLFEALQRHECFWNSVQTALVGRDQVQDVAMIGRYSCQHFRRSERFAMLTALAAFADASDLKFDR
jgi:hypothetical protein